MIKHFPPHKIYTESFGGAGSVLLKKKRSHSEVWNDIEGEVVNLFRVLQNRTQSAELRRLLYLTPFSREEFEKSYELSPDPVEGARRLVVRSYQGFASDAHNRRSSSGFRPGSHGSRTTPAHDWANYPGALSAAIKRLRGVVIENRDALKIMAQHDSPDTLHYVDPPYLHGTRSYTSSNRHNYTHEMFALDHQNLAVFLNGLKGMVVLSGYPSKFYDRLYSTWTTYERKSFAFKATERVEVLWLNKAALLRLNGIRG